METSFYTGAVVNSRRLSSIHSQSSMMKKEIHLNLDQQSSELKSNADGMLNSTDLGLLKLASPDLERLIIQSNGMIAAAANATTAAAPQNSQFLYPKSASDEQEFAEGFVKALEDLHKQNQLTEAACVSVDRLELIGSNAVSAGLPASDLPVYTTLNGYAGSPLGATVNYSADALPFPPPPPHLPGAQASAAAAAAAAALSRLQSASGGVKDEPQTVPDMQSFGESPPLSPIDMDNQERIKAERKKLRNRIAASKCRKRKLERISRLEDKVKSLKTQNTELASAASVLREQVAQLKQKVMNHVSNGCQLLPNQVQAY